MIFPDIMVTDDIVKMGFFHISFHLHQMKESLVTAGLGRYFSPRQHIIDLHGHQGSINQNTFSSPGMDSLAVDGKFCGGRIEILIFDTSFIPSVQSIGIICPKSFYVKIF